MNEIILLRELLISWKKSTLEEATVLCFAQSQRDGSGLIAPVLSARLFSCRGALSLKC